jgi:hypothetical protein
MLMTGLVSLAYVALVVLATQVLNFQAPATAAAAALAAAALFNLPRRRLQRVVNRRFRRQA